MKPPIIAIEGENPSGVETQLHLLEKGLINAGLKVAVFNFPNYGNGSSYFIKEYESGKYSPNLNPYATSTFFALDRFDAQKQIAQALANKDIIIVANYMGAAMANLGINFTNKDQRKAFFVWLDGFETQLFGNVRPTHNFVISTGSNTKLNESFLSLCQDFPKDYSYVKLPKYTDTKILDIILDTIAVKKEAEPSHTPTKSKKNTASLLDLLRAPQPPHDLRISREYIDIEGLNSNQQDVYRQGVDNLNRIRNKILKQVPKDKVHYTSEFLSLLSSVVSYSGEKIAKTVVKQGGFEDTLHQNVSLQYSSGVSLKAELANVHPRNQMTIVNDILFAVTDLSSNQIVEQTNKMPYEDKADLIKNYIADGHTTGLNDVMYTFNIGASLHDILWLKRTLKKELVIIQEPSPRNGYDVPKFAAKHSALFEDYFDALIELNSTLSNTPASRYLVALGNVASAKVKVSYQDIKYLGQFKNSPQIIHDMIMQAKVTHPIIYE